MGGACSRKRDQQDSIEDLHRGSSGRYSRNISCRWAINSLIRAVGDTSQCNKKPPSLLELSVRKICERIDRYDSFTMLPRDLSQQIFNELIYTQALTRASLQAFQDCALQDVLLGEYPGVDDSWLEVLAIQDSSLLAVDVLGSVVTDSGLALVQDCSNLQSLNFNYCDHISDVGLQYLSGLTNLTSLSFKRSNAITTAGLRALAGLLNLTSLDQEIKTTDNRILQEQLQMKISENSEMQETILLLKQQLTAAVEKKPTQRTQCNEKAEVYQNKK